MIRLIDILKEEFEDMKMVDFAQKRLGGATKIASDAKEKGGPAILTYHHFAVKLPYYKEASEGKFDMSKAQSEYDSHMNQLHELMKSETPNEVEFQKIVGLLEVLGELIIKQKNQNISEHHHQTPNERIGKYKIRIQKLRDKISQAKDKNTDTVKLQKNQIKVIQQTMNNFKQAQSIKKSKEQNA